MSCLPSPPVCHLLQLHSLLSLEPNRGWGQASFKFCPRAILRVLLQKARPAKTTFDVQVYNSASCQRATHALVNRTRAWQLLTPEDAIRGSPHSPSFTSARACAPSVSENWERHECLALQHRHLAHLDARERVPTTSRRSSGTHQQLRPSARHHLRSTSSTDVQKSQQGGLHRRKQEPRIEHQPVHFKRRPQGNHFLSGTLREVHVDRRTL